MLNFLPIRKQRRLAMVCGAIVLFVLGGEGAWGQRWLRENRQAPQRPAQIVRRQAPPRPAGAAAPIERRAPGAVNGAVQRPQAANGGGVMVGANPSAGSPKGHLKEWMSQHSGLTASQQQQALEREPGFRQLPAQEQQRMRDRLTQLNAMPPQQRERMLAHAEAMEKLSPEQRGEVRGAMQQLGTLPPDQRQGVARSFRELRQLPPEQRLAAMNSARYQNLNEAQRATLGNLIRVAPMLPPPEPAQPR